LPPPAQDEKLVVAVRPGPTSWYPGPDGQPAGFDHDLLARFADEHKLKLEIVEVGSAAALLAKVAAGEVHIGAGGLYRPPAGLSRITAADDGPRVLWTSGFYAVEPVLIYTTDSFKPKDWKDLGGAGVAYVEGTGIESSLAKIRKDHPEVQWKPLDLPSADALIAKVSDGNVDYAIVPSIDTAAFAQHLSRLRRRLYRRGETGPRMGRRTAAAEAA
jgi:membrane-bound lytic murein transglycosylase F